MALALEHSGQINKAKKELRKAISNNPNSFMAQLSMGKLLYQNKDFEGAYEFLTNAHKIAPDNIDALILYAQCSAKLQTVNTDKVLCSSSLKQNIIKTNLKFIMNSALIIQNQTNLSKAAQNLTEAYKLAPNNPNNSCKSRCLL